MRKLQYAVKVFKVVCGRSDPYIHMHRDLYVFHYVVKIIMQQKLHVLSKSPRRGVLYPAQGKAMISTFIWGDLDITGISESQLRVSIYNIMCKLFCK